MAKNFVVIADASLTVALTIERKADGYFWTGSAWQVGAATVGMTEVASYSTSYSQYHSSTAPTAPCFWKALDASDNLIDRGEFTGTGVSVDSTAGSWPPSLADVHTFLHLKSGTTGDDALLDIVRVKAKDAIEEYCQRIFASASRTFYLGGNGTTLLPVPQWPITSITSIYESIAVPRDWTVTEVDSDNYMVSNDSSDQHDESKNKILRIDGATWPAGVQNIRVIATVGYSTIPNPLYQGCMELIMHSFFRATKKNIGVTNRSEQGGSEGYDLERGLMPSVVKGLIDPYRSIGAMGFV